MRVFRMLTVAAVSAATVLMPVSGPALAAPEKAPKAAPVQPGSPGSGSIALGPSKGTLAMVAGPVTVPKGTGAGTNATFTTFDLSDRVVLQVHAGSGNLLLRTTDLVLPGISTNVVLGAAFNSLLVGSEIETGAHGRGWRARTGPDTKLIKNDDNSVTYAAADGLVGTFTPTSGGYDTPKEFKGTLKQEGSGWKFTENSGGRDLYFTSSGQLDKVEDRNDNVIDYQYNSAGELTKVVTDRGATGARTAVVTYKNGRIQRLQQAVDASNSRQVIYSYNNAGNLTQIAPTSGRAVKFTYDSSQRIKKITTGFSSEPGTETRVEYDSLHRVAAVLRVLENESVDNPDGRLAITRWAYTSSTEVQVADPNTDITKRVSDVAHTTYTTDSDKRITKAVDPDGNERSRSYTPYHDVATSTDAMGQSVGNRYDANNGQSLTSTTTPTGSSSTAAYNNAATTSNPTAGYQPSSGGDAQKNQSSYTYNGAGNKMSAKNAEAAEAKVDYNSDGTVKTATDPANTGNPTNYAYNGDKQLITITPPTGNSLAKREFTYDAFGRVRTATDGGGRTTTNEYDTDDRLVRTSYSDSTESVEYEYDGSGNLIERTHGKGEKFVFDRLNRLIQRGPDYYLTQYTYDPAGNLTKLHGDYRGDTVYSYDKRNLLKKMEVDGATYTFEYDKEGRRTDTKLSVEDAGPTTTAHTKLTYDKSGRITRTTSKRWERVNNADQEFTTYDVSYCYSKRVGTAACDTTDTTQDTSLRQWQTEHHRGGVVQVYTYDKANRLTKATNLAPGSFDYTYDANGNRTTVKVNGTETQRLTFNSGNQITTSGYTYDGAGNQLTGSATRSAEYNAAGQTTGNKTSGNKEAYFHYLTGDQSELESVWVDEDENDQMYFAWGRGSQGGTALEDYQAVDGDTHFLERDGTGSLVGVRVHEKKTGKWVHYFPTLDGNGSVVGLTNQNGTYAGHWTYDPYGRTTNTTANQPVVNSFAIGYAGGLKHASTGLIKFGKRWYDPEIGRFTQQDNLNTIGDPTVGNRYAYAGADPINNTDPTGLVVASIGFEVCYVICAGLNYEIDDQGNQGVTGTIGVGAGGGFNSEIGGGTVEEGVNGYGQCSAGPFNANVEESAATGEDEYSASVSPGSTGAGCSLGISGTQKF
ncbi:RHS repeat-associated core domain-containing protein [Micromonospora sp. CA-269861]|uniref:RHS repeat-associated core domain-containing protein n=1 Tax=Micromonospora sp. CA-269861 TaxID=3239968 RepID=UPI003D92B4CE